MRRFLAAFSILLAVLRPCAAQVLSSQSLTTIPATYFGIHLLHLVNGPPTTSWPTSPFPVSTLRTQNTGIFWKDINTANGIYSWTLFDTFMAEAVANGVDDVSYSFFYTPAWASSNPSYDLLAADQ